MATQANHFTFDGSDIHGTFDTTSLTGKEQASLQVDGDEVKDVSVERTGRGFELSGIVSQIPDDRTISALVLIPEVNLADGTPAVFSGVAVVTTARTSIGGPQLVTGAIHSYEVRPIAGEASTVQSLSATNC